MLTKKILLSLTICSHVLLSAQAPPCIIAAAADSLILLSRQQTDKSQFDAALRNALAVEHLARQQCGETTAIYGDACFNLGRVYYFKGDYNQAEPWYITARQIRATVFGAKHLEYAKCQNNLAILYDETSQFEQAEALYLDALDIRATILGKQSAPYAAVLNNLASLYRKMGDFENAEALSQEALEIRANTIGKQHIDYAQNLNNLANLYYDIGNYSRSEQYYKEAISILEALGEKQSALYALCLDNMGALYQIKGAIPKAERYYQEASQLQQTLGGEKHPDYISTVAHLALLYQETKDFDRSKQHWEQVLTLSASAFGKESLNYGLYLQNMADLYGDRQQYTEAIRLNHTALDIIQHHVGTNHIQYLNSLIRFASWYYLSGSTQKAREYLMQASKLNKHLLLHSARYLSEQELAQFTQTFSWILDREFSLISSMPDMAYLGFDDMLFYKGFTLDCVTRSRKMAYSSTEGKALYQKLQSYQRLLAAEYAKPVNERLALTDLESKVNAAEKELNRVVSNLNETKHLIDWKQVNGALKSDEAMVEFVMFKQKRPDAPEIIKYGALLLTGEDASVRFISLFDEDQITRLLSDKSGEMTESFCNQLYQNQTPGELIWAPLQPWFKNIKTVYYTPVGIMHRLNIGALSNGAGKIYADRIRLIQIGSARQLIDSQPKEETTTASALLFGDIQYSVGQPEAQTTPKNQLRNRKLAVDPGDPSRSKPWELLNWTGLEVRAISEILKETGTDVTLKTAQFATEESFKNIRKAPSVIHIATHGFFFPDPVQHVSVFKSATHPMMRSGLVMAGGNHAWLTGKPAQPDTEDGILTALEISQMDLSGAQLVVLSACETGLGDIRGNEGVYGLQRAFKIAGAKYLIMSLWKVPDFQTQEFMTNFYSNWKADKMSIPEAFQTAQQNMRKLHPEPFYWAGFVLIQ